MMHVVSGVLLLSCALSPSLGIIVRVQEVYERKAHILHDPLALRHLQLSSFPKNGRLRRSLHPEKTSREIPFFFARV